MKNTTINTYCLATINAEPLSPIYPNLYTVIEALYIKYYNKKSYDNLTIIHYYMNIPYSTYNIKYDAGLVIYNNKTQINILSTFPEFTSLDNYINIQQVSILPPTNNIPNRQTIPLLPIDPSTNIQNRQTIQVLPIDPSTNMHNRQTMPVSPIYQSTNIHNRQTISVPPINPSNNISNLNTETSDVIKKSNKVKSGISSNTIYNKANEVRCGDNVCIAYNEKLRIFSSDKKAYVLIKNDIENGKLREADINEIFIDKYRIFKILDARKTINFASDLNIKNEFLLFSELIEVKEEIEETETKLDAASVYIPHNYGYMDKNKKEEYAKKYNMSLEDFEAKYISSDIIVSDKTESGTDLNNSDIYIIPEFNVDNDKPPLDILSFTDSDTDTDSDIESETETELETKLANIKKFMKMRQNYQSTERIK